MKTRTRTIWIALDSVFLIVYNVCFFLLTENTSWFPNGRTAAMWVNYGCLHFAYLFLILSTFLILHNVVKETVAPATISVFLRFFGIELVVAGVLIGLMVPLVYTIVIQTIIIAFYVARICIMLLADTDTAEKEQRHEQELLYVKTAEAQLRPFLMSLTDKSTIRKVEQTYDYIRTSPVRSCRQVHLLELQILDKICLLVNMADNGQIGQISDEILKLAKKRNQQLLILNKKL